MGGKKVDELTGKFATIGIHSTPRCKKKYKKNPKELFLKKIVQAKEMDGTDGITPIKKQLQDLAQFAQKNHCKREKLRARFLLGKLAITGNISDSN
ncbi:MAG TPA: hypothetical protein VHO47_01145 [Candidatus Babeliales bacterium]|nr:hypothetical protein [Candidatus Babeliales bacterium]